MENEIDELKAKRKKLFIIAGTTLFIVGLILMLAPKKKVKPKLPVITPLPKPKTKVIKKTITIKPTETVEEEEEEIEEETPPIETPPIEEEVINE